MFLCYTDFGNLHSDLPSQAWQDSVQTQPRTRSLRRSCPAYRALRRQINSCQVNLSREATAAYLRNSFERFRSLGESMNLGLGGGGWYVCHGLIDAGLFAWNVGLHAHFDKWWYIFRMKKLQELEDGKDDYFLHSTCQGVVFKMEFLRPQRCCGKCTAWDCWPCCGLSNGAFDRCALFYEGQVGHCCWLHAGLSWHQCVL